MITLLFAHFIGDVGLQPDWVLNRKQGNWFVLLEHCFVWTAIISLGLLSIGKYSTYKAVYLIATHYLIDLWKIKSTKDPLNMKYLLADQLLHLFQLITVYLW